MGQRFAIGSVHTHLHSGATIPALHICLGKLGPPPSKLLRSNELDSGASAVGVGVCKVMWRLAGSLHPARCLACGCTVLVQKEMLSLMPRIILSIWSNISKYCAKVLNWLLRDPKSSYGSQIPIAWKPPEFSKCIPYYSSKYKVKGDWGGCAHV